MATIAFVGNSNAHLADGVATNTLLPSDIADRTNVCGSPCGGAAGGVDADYYRQFLGFSGITTVMDEVNVHYESLQATLRGNSWKGLTFGSAYTYSHAFDVEDAQIFASIDNPVSTRTTQGARLGLTAGRFSSVAQATTCQFLLTRTGWPTIWPEAGPWPRS